jgi:hypothetical protein
MFRLASEKSSVPLISMMLFALAPVSAWSGTGLDFGDAPAPYPTTLVQNGARHLVADDGLPRFGEAVDIEEEGAPSENFDGDDLLGSDDEGGVFFPLPLARGTEGLVVFDPRTAATGGSVSIWIDYSGDGIWQEPAESVVSAYATGGDRLEFARFPVPVDARLGPVAVRARIFAGAGTLRPTGFVVTGEVEDLTAVVEAQRPDLGVALASGAVRVRGHAFDVDLVLTVENLGNVRLERLELELDGLEWFGASSGITVLGIGSSSLPFNTEYDGVENLHLVWDGSLAPGSQGTVELSLRISPPAGVFHFVGQARAVAHGPAGQVVSDFSQRGSEADPDGDGSALDDDEPTDIVVVRVLEVPVLDGLGLGLFALLLGALGWHLRRVRDHASAG